ncbi:hypothetical protein NCCP1664_25730 [Zafaria cholistanensis]|uniref:DUF4232 domain-containing protein n=1 Tax=Zafaria cholistanensis TaxID=1682741 RepID=A0A5A7NVF6_9MICC|nr:hypothetical protein [Zafaria cholistanensis]GER24078.1 hypothetical protein NCCP1664_25730 [Zafaria cholistanensis]
MAPEQSRPAPNAPVPPPASASRPTRPSPAVYRRRRLVALALLLAVAALLVWAVAALVGLFRAEPAASGQAASSAAAPQPAPAPAVPSAAAGEATTASSGGIAACTEADIAVAASTSRKSYSSSQTPVLVMTITNVGSSACRVNVGTSQQDFSVSSGSDRIFSTTDCLADPTDAEITIRAGKSETARFAWERKRSAPGCKSVSAKPRPGTYVLTAKLGETTSGKVPFVLK